MKKAKTSVRRANKLKRKNDSFLDNSICAIDRTHAIYITFVGVCVDVWMCVCERRKREKKRERERKRKRKDTFMYSYRRLYL